MSLTLKVISYKGLPPIAPIQAEIGSQGGTIGRKVGNTLVLPDSENVVSGKHAEIIYQNGTYILRDTSTNGTFLVHSGAGLNNSETTLQGNEVLRIGEYEVSVSVLADLAAGLDSPFSRGFDALVPAPGLPSDPFGGGSSPLGFDEVKPFFSTSTAPSPELPFDSTPLFADAPAFGAAPAFPETPAFPAATFADPAPVFKEQAPTSPFHDSFSLPEVSPVSEPSQDISSLLKGLDALDGLSGFDAAPPVATPPPLAEPAPFVFADPAPVPAVFTPPPSVLDPPVLTPHQQQEADDYLKALSQDSSAAFVPAQPETPPQVVLPNIVPPPVSPVQAVVPPPQPQAASAPVTPVQPMVAAPVPVPVPAPTAPVAPPAPSISEAQLLKMFLAGAGISDPNFIPAEQWPEVMKTVGTLFRSLTEGLMEVLRARAEMKSEFRVAMTTIRSLDNNPLKFNPDVESVMKLMMAPKNPAFIDANEAVKEGFRDIKFHQMAMTAGIQASLAEILFRFNPESFEKMIGEGLVFQKKARFWELYCEKYPELKTRAVEEFFGDEFAEAYEKQMRMFSQR